AFMQYPQGYAIGPGGALQLVDVWSYLFNAWVLWQYAHTMTAAVITGAFAVAALGAYWSLMGIHQAQAQACLRVAVVVGLIASLLQLFPTGDRQGRLLAAHQPVALAAAEGKFVSSSRAELVIIGQPDVNARRLENRIVVPAVLSFLAYGSFGALVRGLEDFPTDQWPDNIELLYYAYHIMVGLGTLFILVMGIAALLLWRGALFRSRAMLWTLLLAFPFPYIANTAGWATAELGRQPWLVYGLQRTRDGTSPSVSAGDVIFTTLGYMGLYLVLGILFLYLVGRQIALGPTGSQPAAR